MNDENPAWVKVNGEKANLSADGTFSHRMLLEDGKNVITVVAGDKAGNQQSKQITVYTKFHAPEITNLKPDQDVYVNTGKTVKIEMDSEPGLDARFTIQKPLTNSVSIQSDVVTELPMTETETGHYVGYWTIPSDWTAKGAQVKVIARDDYGNQTEKVAEGKLYINIPNEKPEASFDVPGRVRAHENITFDGSASEDSDGSIVKYVWHFGDGDKAVGKKVVHRYSKKGKYRVKLTVTDNRGATDSMTRRIHVLRNQKH